MCWANNSYLHSSSLPLSLFSSLSLPCLLCPCTQVLQEIEAMEGSIRELNKAIADKQKPMMLAQTRLELRFQRPNQELVRDPVQYGLVDEVSEISGSIEQLQTSLADSESTLKALIRSQLSLEENIRVKANSLHIEGQCMTLRKQLSTASN